MRIWIDAGSVSRSPQLFGMTPLDRILRSIARLANSATEVVISGDVATQAKHGCRVIQEAGPAGERLAAYLTSGDTPVLAIDGAAIVDHRLLPLLMEADDPACFVAGKGEKRASLLRLAPDSVPPHGAHTVLDIADAMMNDGDLRRINAKELPDFVVNLRRNVPFTLERIADDRDRAALEKRLFQLNYKGSTDFMTKWVFPPVVWQLTKLCVRWNIHPNTVTIASILLAVAAVPLFANGYWFAGFLAAYGMAILDSVDGKVARVTLNSSSIGNILDHGLDIVHPPFWYAAWAIGLGATAGSPLYAAMLWLIFFYVADRIALMVAKWRFKRGLHAVTALDAAARTWIARRNVNLVIFTLGILIGLGKEAFFFIMIWQGLTFCWHSVRTGWLYPRSRYETYIP